MSTLPEIRHTLDGLNLCCVCKHSWPLWTLPSWADMELLKHYGKKGWAEKYDILFFHPELQRTTWNKHLDRELSCMLLLFLGCLISISATWKVYLEEGSAMTDWQWHRRYRSKLLSQPVTIHEHLHNRSLQHQESGREATRISILKLQSWLPQRKWRAWPGAGIMEADDCQVMTVFTAQPLFHHRHSTNRVSWSVTIVSEHAVTPHLVVRCQW